MTKATKITLITLLALAVALPALAWGPGGGRSGGMMGGFDGGPGNNQTYTNTTLTQEQQTQLNDLQKKSSDETAELRNQMVAKSNELRTALNGADPDADKVKALQGEINEIRAKISEIRIGYDLEAKKISPEGYGTRGNNSRMGRINTTGPGATCCL